MESRLASTALNPSDGYLEESCVDFLSCLCLIMMYLLRTKAGVTLTTLMFLFLGSLQSIMYFFNVYPNALKDLMINQQIGYIGSKSSDYGLSARGKVEMKNSSITFVGVGKSIDKNLIHNLLKDMDDLSQEFSSSRAIIAIDSTAFSMQKVFLDWAKKSPTNRTILIAIAPSFEKKGLFLDSESTLFPREGKIAEARNMVLNEYNKGPSTDYIMNIDLDIIGWDVGGVRDSFGQNSHWDVACANGVILHGAYRDAYALRAPGIMTNHHLSGDDYAQFGITPAEKEAYRREFKLSKRRVQKLMDGAGSSNAQGDTNLIKLDSCFGGLAIYRTSAIADCRYTHRYATPPQVVDCEHVFYHQCLAQKHQARIVSNPNMKIWYGHTSLSYLDYSKLFRETFGVRL